MQPFEIAGLAVAALIIAVAFALLVRRTGEVGSWAWSWAVLILAGALLQLGVDWPPIRAGGVVLAALFPALQFAGALEHVGRRVPRWLIPAFGALAVLRLATVLAGFEAHSHMVIVGFEIAALAAASIVVHRWGVAEARMPVAGLLIAGFCVIGFVEATDAVLDITSAPPGVSWTVWLGIGIPVGGSQLVATFARLVRGLEESVHEREVAEQALEESNAGFRAITDHAHDLIVEADASRRIQYANPRFSEVLGYELDEVLGRDLREFAWNEAEFPTRADLGVDRELDTTAIMIRHRDGTPRWVEYSARVHIQEGEPRIVVIGRDVSERLRIEEQMRRAQKLDALGVLAGGIAHDFNNLLVGIVGNASLLAESVDRTDPERRQVDGLIEAAERARGLTEQLLTFARGGEPIREAASVADLIRQTAHFSLSGSQVACDLDLQEGLWAAEVDKGQISQVISNLLINAMQATNGSGRIRVRALNTVIEADAIPNLKAGQYVKLSIEDEGEGIAPENVPRIFDPYFSTKADGSGLGLATSWSIIRRHGGTIVVDSIPGEGSTFDVFIPAENPPVRRRSAPRPVARLEASRVLVMDDEANVRTTTLRMLAKLGCRGEEAADGAQLLAMVRAAVDHGEPYDLVIMDLTVPGGMGGEEAIWKLRELDRGVRAIVSSGYSDSPVLAKPEAAGFDGVLVKPYRLAALRDALVRALSLETS